MPHITLEYSQNLDATLDINALVKAAHEAAERSDLFDSSAIKTRAIAFDHYLVAGQVQDFIHLRAHILSGRSESQKQQLSQCLLEGVEALACRVPSLTVEVVDMDRHCYAKRAL